MRRLAAFTVLTLLLLTIGLSAQAHDWTGDGDCEGWNLVLDGVWGAHTIYVDGVDVDLDLTVRIADDSAATSRTFVVFWDKTRNDVTVTHTLDRSDDCTPTTTTQPEVTTTTSNNTTTTQPETTTTQPTTTTTIQECAEGLTHEPPFCVPPTTPEPTNPQIVTVPTTPEGETELPFTSGGETGMLALAALSLLVLGGAMIRKAA